MVKVDDRLDGMRFPDPWRLDKLVREFRGEIRIDEALGLLAESRRGLESALADAVMFKAAVTYIEGRIEERMNGGLMTAPQHRKTPAGKQAWLLVGELQSGEAGCNLDGEQCEQHNAAEGNVDDSCLRVRFADLLTGELDNGSLR